MKRNLAAPAYQPASALPVGSTRSRQGTTTVELAMVLPIIFLLFFVSLEITAVNMIRHTAGNAAYEGARVLSVPGGNRQVATQTALELLRNVGVHRGATVQMTETGSRVDVTVRVPAQLNSWGLSRFTGGITVTQSCSLTKEQAL